MKKIGIINCFEVSKRCTGSGCFKSVNNKTGSFERYNEEDIEMISFIHCNGCGEESINQVLERADKMKKHGVEVIHLSTCIKSKCPKYEVFMEELSKKFEVVGYSHGNKK